MKLTQIREKVAYLEQPKNDLKMAGRIWSQHIFQGTVAVTLTLKQSFKVVTDCGTYYKRIDRDECHKIANRFKKKLNQLVYGNASKRYQKSLPFLISVESGAGGLNFHLHMTIGEFPPHIKLSEIEALILKAKNKVPEINKEYEVTICYDTGWSEYVVKTIGKTNTDSILWDLA
jgi:hypothetical protein